MNFLFGFFNPFRTMLRTHLVSVSLYRKGEVLRERICDTIQKPVLWDAITCGVGTPNGKHRSTPGQWREQVTRLIHTRKTKGPTPGQTKGPTPKENQRANTGQHRAKAHFWHEQSTRLIQTA